MTKSQRALGYGCIVWLGLDDGRVVGHCGSFCLVRPLQNLRTFWRWLPITMHVFWRDAGRHHILLGIPWSIPFIRLACMSQVANLNSCCVACVLLPLLSVPLIVFSVGEQIAFILIISTGPALITSRPYATCPGRLTPWWLEQAGDPREWWCQWHHFWENPNRQMCQGGPGSQCLWEMIASLQAVQWAPTLSALRHAGPELPWAPPDLNINASWQCQRWCPIQCKSI